MSLAMCCSPDLLSAATNDNQFDPPFLITLSSPLNQAAMHSIKHFLTFPLQFSSMALRVGSYKPR
uniref:Uncharacterized protein n=1 Tax=Amphimedon queenslandica TaxID=400682 RepID=A0A1X7VFT3_AMPQE